MFKGAHKESHWRMGKAAAFVSGRPGSCGLQHYPQLNLGHISEPLWDPVFSFRKWAQYLDCGTVQAFKGIKHANCLAEGLVLTQWWVLAIVLRKQKPNEQKAEHDRDHTFTRYVFLAKEKEELLAFWLDSVMQHSVSASPFLLRISNWQLHRPKELWLNYSPQTMKSMRKRVPKIEFLIG